MRTVRAGHEIGDQAITQGQVRDQHFGRTGLGTEVFEQAGDRQQ